MSHLFKPTVLLNNVCANLGLSDSFAELLRQGLEMSYFIGMEPGQVAKIFEDEIRQDLAQFVDTLDDGIEWDHPHVAIRVKAAQALGLLS